MAGRSAPPVMRGTMCRSSCPRSVCATTCWPWPAPARAKVRYSSTWPRRCALCGLARAAQADPVSRSSSRMAMSCMPSVGSFPLTSGITWCWSISPPPTILWASSYGSRTENVLEYALKTLADANELLIQSDPYQGPDRQYTLLDVMPLLRAASFRHAVLEQVRDRLLIDWWQHYYEPLDAHQQREITSSVITKLSKFA